MNQTLQNRYIERVRRQARIPANTVCCNCAKRLPTYIVMEFATFVCDVCADVHRKFSHSGIKGISVSNFSKQDVERIENGGNDVAQEYWFPRSFKDTDKPDPYKIDATSFKNRIVDFINSVYVHKTYIGNRTNEFQKKLNGDTTIRPSKENESSLEKLNSKPTSRRKYSSKIITDNTVKALDEETKEKKKDDFDFGSLFQTSSTQQNNSTKTSQPVKKEEPKKNQTFDIDELFNVSSTTTYDSGNSGFYNTGGFNQTSNGGFNNSTIKSSDPFGGTNWGSSQSSGGFNSSSNGLNKTGGFNQTSNGGFTNSTTKSSGQFGNTNWGSGFNNDSGFGQSSGGFTSGSTTSGFNLTTSKNSGELNSPNGVKSTTVNTTSGVPKKGSNPFDEFGDDDDGDDDNPFATKSPAQTKAPEVKKKDDLFSDLVSFDVPKNKTQTSPQKSFNSGSTSLNNSGFTSQPVLKSSPNKTVVSNQKTNNVNSSFGNTKPVQKDQKFSNLSNGFDNSSDFGKFESNDGWGSSNASFGSTQLGKKSVNSHPNKSLSAEEAKKLKNGQMTKISREESDKHSWESSFFTDGTKTVDEIQSENKTDFDKQFTMVTTDIKPMQSKSNWK